jgi:hypothetical protein
LRLNAADFFFDLTVWLGGVRFVDGHAKFHNLVVENDWWPAMVVGGA